MKPYATGRFRTATATLVIFDPLCLADRVEDTCDWWSDPDEEIEEINRGNVLFVALGGDGDYSFDLFRLGAEDSLPPAPVLANLRTIMGAFYIGAGEEVVGEGLGPSSLHGGLLVTIPSGSYKVAVNLRADRPSLDIHVKPTSDEPRNFFTESPSVIA